MSSSLDVFSFSVRFHFAAFKGFRRALRLGRIAHCPRRDCPLQALAAPFMPRYRGRALEGTASTMTGLRLLYDFD
jgi:hypothetical protein